MSSESSGCRHMRPNGRHSDGPRDYMFIRRGTTPTVALLLGADIRDWPTVIVTLACGDRRIDFGLDRIEFADPPEGAEGVIVRVTLTQEETLDLSGRVTFQLRAVDANGIAVATRIAAARVAEIINEEVIG